MGLARVREWLHTIPTSFWRLEAAWQRGRSIAVEPVHENTRRTLTIHDNMVSLSKRAFFIHAAVKYSAR
jgi:hypothetical protein